MYQEYQILDVRVAERLSAQIMESACRVRILPEIVYDHLSTITRGKYPNPSPLLHL